MSATGSRRSRREHGPDSVAFLSTGQIATEEMALLGSLAKFGMGIVHGDGNTRQCMATAVVAYKQAFGFDAPPYTYRDFEESDVHRPGRREPLHRAPDHVGAGLPQPATTRDHRRRPAQDRDGDGRHDCTCRSGRSPTSSLFYGIARISDPRGLDRPRLHRRAHDGLRRVRGVRPSIHAERGVADATGLAERRSSSSPGPSTRASGSRSGGRWASTRATRASARRRA